MSTSVPPRDSAKLAGSTGKSAPSYFPDEQALKRAFDANYDAALESARGQLGEATSMAPRVVEVAFLNTWNQRETLATEEQFKALLADEIRHGSARALSRRASGHRFGSVGGGTQTGPHAVVPQADAQHVWSQIQRTIHGEGQSAAAHAAVATASRHEAATHMKSVAKRRSWAIPIAVGVITIIAAVAIALYIDRLGEDEAIVTAVNQQGIQPIASNSGQIGTVTLGDGTKMKIGPETRVAIPDGFPTKIRAVKVDGAASFEVAPGLELPFRVVAKRVHFIATGTKFVISAFPTDSGVGVQVREGSVTVKGAGKPTIVSANSSALVEKGAVRQATADEQAQAFGWVDGRISVQHKQLRTVVAELTRWFNYDVKVTDLPLLDREASFAVPLDSSRLAISQVEQSANVKFAYEGETKVFRDAKPAPPKKKTK
jgi:ferric-dicitrate binding protein FerR (iron transport regulator)